MSTNVRWALLIILLAVDARRAAAQSELQVDDLCNYSGENYSETLYSFAADDGARAALQQIMKSVGLESNFVIAAANVPNAAAAIQGQTRYLLYSQTFMNDLRKATGDSKWTMLSVFAHEIGHHLQGHTLSKTGSRPKTELEADKYSGFVMAQMGASLDEAHAAITKFGSASQTETHPGKQARRAAIAAGWTNWRDLQKSKPDAKELPEEAAVPQATQVHPQPTTSPPAMAATYVARCVFFNDPVAYFLTSTDSVVALAPNGSLSFVARRIPPTAPGLSWMYAGAYATYGVDPSGRIWARHPNGQAFQVGYVTNL